MNGCDSDSLFNFTSKFIRYFYKTAFYLYNTISIPAFILCVCYNSDKKFEQKIVKWIFYGILSFLIIDIFSFIHFMLYGKKTNFIRNTIFGLLGFLVSLVIYKCTCEDNIYKYLLIPTAYYYIINNLFVYLMTKKWREKLYPLYGSVGYLFVFLAIPIILFLIAIVFLYKCGECCEKGCNNTGTYKHENSYSNNHNVPSVHSVEEQREEPSDENN